MTSAAGTSTVVRRTAGEYNLRQEWFQRPVKSVGSAVLRGRPQSRNSRTVEIEAWLLPQEAGGVHLMTGCTKTER